MTTQKCSHTNRRNEDRYAGEYFGDKSTGLVCTILVTAIVIKGSWHEGLKQGYGMYTLKRGEWDCGFRKTHLPQQMDSVLQAVQEVLAKPKEDAEMNILSLKGEQQSF